MIVHYVAFVGGVVAEVVRYRTRLVGHLSVGVVLACSRGCLITWGCD